MRRGEEELARQTLENLASGIDADISRNIELYDLSLRAVASNMVMPEIKDVSKAIRHLILFDHAATAKHFGAIQVFDATGQADHRRRDARSGAGKSRRRRVLQGSSRQSRHRPVHQPPDAASGRLFDRAQPTHHRRRRQLSRRGRRLDPLQLFPRPVRPADTSSPDDTITVLRRDRHDHHADAVRSRHHRQEFGGTDRAGAQQPERRLSICRRRAGRFDAAAVTSRSGSTSPLFVVVGKPLDDHPEALAHGGDPDRRDHDGADRVRARQRRCSSRARSAAARRPRTGWRNSRRPTRSPG